MRAALLLTSLIFLFKISLVAQDTLPSAATKNTPDVGTASKKKLDGIMATVNSEPIFISDIEKLRLKLKKDGLVDESIAASMSISLASNKESELLNFLILEKVIESEVKKLNLTVTNDRVEQEIRETAKRNGMQRTDLLAAIKNQGLSEVDYKDMLKQKIERNSLFEQEIISKLRITDDEAFSEYVKINPKAKARSYEYKIQHIFFNPFKTNPDEALQRAAEAYKKLTANTENFENLAKQVSEDKNFTDNGLLGTFKSGEFNADFETAIKNLDVGGHTKVIQSKTGFHILKLADKKIIPDPAFEREKEKIKSRLFDQNFKRQLKTWLESKKEDSSIATKN